MLKFETTALTHYPLVLSKTETLYDLLPININVAIVFKEQETNKYLRILGSTEHLFAFLSSAVHQLE